MAESYEAIEQLKKYITQALLLAKPSPKNIFYLYLAASDQASQPRDEVENLLSGPQNRSPDGPTLKRHFDSPKESERLIKWAIEVINLVPLDHEEDKLIDVEKTKLHCISIENELAESVKKVEILSNQLEREQEVIKAWKTSRDVSAQISKVQGIESFCETAWDKNKKKLELIDGLSTDVESTDDESYPLKEEKEHSLKVPQLKQADVYKTENLKKLNKKFGSTSKNFVKEEASTSKDFSKVNIGHMTLEQLKNRLKVVEDKKETKRKSNRNGKVGVNKHNNYTRDNMPQMPYNMPIWNNMLAQSMPYQIPNVLNDSVTNPTPQPTTFKIKVDSKLPKSKDAGGMKSGRKANKNGPKETWVPKST
ncbi:hypothetical protein AgCh_026466 [Apium graveolens]